MTGEGSGLTQKPTVPEPEPPGLCLGSLGFGKLRTLMVKVTSCYWKMLWVKTGSGVVAFLCLYTKL